MCFVKAALPVSTFFTIVTLIFSLDLFSHDGVLVAPPRDARVVAATWRVIVTLHPPQLLPMTDWVAVIQTSIANRPELSDDATRTWWSLRLRRLDGLIPHPGRRRRAIFGFVSEISRVLFGTATESEVDDVRRVVTTVDANQKDIVHNSKELWSLLNGTREYVQQNRRTIFSLAKYSSQMSRLLNWTVQQYHFLTIRVKSLRFMHEIDRAIDHLEFMSDHYSLRWEDYLSGLTSLSEGHLTRQMVSPSVLHGVRARMTARGYDTLPTDWYYRHAETFILTNAKDSLIFVANLPTVHSEKYLHYTLFYVPVPFGGTHWRRIVGAPFVMVNSISGKRFKPGDCLYGHPIVCTNAVQYDRLCEVDLIQRSSLSCPTDVYAARLSTIVTPISMTQLAVSVLRPTVVIERCPGHEPRRYDVVTAFLCTLRPGCQWQGRGWSFATPDHIVERVVLNTSSVYLHLPPLNATWPETVPPPVVEALKLQAYARVPPLETLSWHQTAIVPFPRRPVFLAPFLVGVILILVVFVGLCCAYRRGVCKSCIPLSRRGRYRFKYRFRPGPPSGVGLPDIPPSKPSQTVELRSLAAGPPVAR